VLFHERRGAQLNVAASPGCCGVSPLKGWRRTVRGLVADRSQAGEGFPLQVKTETFAEMAPNLSPRPFRSAGPEDGGTAGVPVEFAERRVGLYSDLRHLQTASLPGRPPPQKLCSSERLK